MTETDAAFVVNISDSLKGDFALLKETQFYHQSGVQSAKFPVQIVDKFARAIVCRNYASLCFELSHLCWAIINTGDDKALFEYFYIDEAVTAPSMRRYFEKQDSDACQLSHATVVLSTDSHDLPQSRSNGPRLVVQIHQHTFSIYCTRAPILAVCMEWLVTILPNIFERFYEYLFGKGYNAIQQLALALQKDIYDYLSEHLPSAKSQAKFHYFSSYLAEHKLSSFTDDNILGVWQSLRNKEGAERLTTVTKDVFQFEEAIQKAKHARAVGHAQDIEALHSNEVVFEALETYANEQIDLDKLCDTPKLISKQQAERMQLLSYYPSQCLNFPLSVLRYNVLGALQAKAIQAKRNKSLNQSSVKPPLENMYAEQIAKLKAQIALNEVTFYAVMHILLQKHPEQALELLTAHSPAVNRLVMDMAKHKDAFLLKRQSCSSDPTNQSAKDLSSDSVQAIQTMLEQPSLLDRCKRAYQQNNRQGFTASSIIDDTFVYTDSTLQLIRLSEALTELMLRYDDLFKTDNALLEKYRSDGYIFSKELAQRMLP